MGQTYSNWTIFEAAYDSGPRLGNVWSGTNVTLVTVLSTNETITVPAGTYQAAKLAWCTTWVAFGDWGSDTEITLKTNWFVSGLGRVKEIATQQVTVITNGQLSSNYTNSWQLGLATAYPTTTVQTVPAGLTIVVDGTNYTAPQTFTWAPGSLHTNTASSPQSGGTGTRYIWSSWSYGGGISSTITAGASNTNYTANFTTQYYLTVSGVPPVGGGVSPASGWYGSGSSVGITATTNSNYTFSGWAGAGTGSYTGSNHAAQVTMNGPISETASFSLYAPTAMRVVNSTGSPGGMVSLPIEMVAQGGENEGTGSLTYDPSILTFVSGDVGSGMPSGTTLTSDTSQIGVGRLGFRISAPPGIPASPGTKQVLVVNFSIARAATAANTAIGFGDQPTVRTLLDMNGNPLNVNWNGGTVTLVGATPPTFTPVKGTYTGLFYPTGGVAQPSSGCFTITTTAKSTLSGSLQIGGTRYSFSGKFVSGSSYTQTVKRGKLSLFTVQLQTDPADSDRMMGTVTAADGSWTAALEGDRAVFNRTTNPALQAGKYTLVIPGSPGSASEPGGDGYGTVKVDAAGKITLVGSLADGTKISQSAVLSKNGEWPLYVPLYSGKGSILSWINYATTATSDLSGDLSWIKPPMPTAKYYPGGFTLEANATGSQYNPPAKGTAVLNISNGQIVLTGGGLGEGIVNYVTLGANNRVTSTSKASLTFTLSSGAFRGTVPNPAGGRSKAISFGGVVLQNQTLGKGYFLGSGQSGEVLFSGAP